MKWKPTLRREAIQQYEKAAIHVHLFIYHVRHTYWVSNDDISLVSLRGQIQEIAKGENIASFKYFKQSAEFYRHYCLMNKTLLSTF